MVFGNKRMGFFAPVIIVTALLLTAFLLVNPLSFSFQPQGHQPATKTLWQVQKNYIEQQLKYCRTDFEKVSVIKDFVTAMVDQGNEEDWGIDIRYPGFRNLSLERIYSLFESDSATALCGATAEILRMFYQQFGFRAFTYNMGNDSLALSHVVTLVEIEDEGQKKLAVADALYNYLLVDSVGRAKDFFSLLQELLLGSTANIHRQPSLVYSDNLFPDERMIAEFLKRKELCRGEIKKIEKSNNPAFACKVMMLRNYDILMQCCSAGEAEILHMLQRRGYPANYYYMFLMKIAGISGPESEITDRKIDSLLAVHRL